MSEVIEGRALGRRPPKNAPALMLAPHLTGLAIAPPPPSVDHFARVKSWLLGENDRFGDCGPVSVANMRLLTTTYLTAHPESPHQNDIFDLYRRSGNPTFDPTTGAGDDGVDMQTMCEALMSGGIAGIKPICFAKVDAGDIDALRAATDIFGSLLLGVTLDVAQQKGALWDFKGPSPEWGGHAIVTGRYHENPNRTSVISWAEVIDMTDAFINAQLDEAWAVIWPEHIGDARFEQGVDIAGLAADYEALTGRKFPIEPPPVPKPVPPPSPDATFAAVLRPWAAARHSGSNAVAAKAAKAWLAAKNL